MYIVLNIIKVSNVGEIKIKIGNINIMKGRHFQVIFVLLGFFVTNIDQFIN